MKKLILIFGIFLFPISLYAADLHFIFGARENDGSRTVALMLYSAKPIGAIAGNMRIPVGITIPAISTEGSMVKLWLDQPHFDKVKHSISFSGISPEGFFGTRSVFRFRSASDPANFVLLNDQIQILLNDGLGTSESLTILPPEYLTASFSSYERAQNFFVPTTATPVAPIVNVPAGHAMLGVHSDPIVVRYEVAYAENPLHADDPLLHWEFLAESSPSSSQTTKGIYVYLKASDNKGNTHVAMFAPVEQTRLVSLPILIFSGIGIILLGGIAFFLRRRKEQQALGLFSDE